MAWLLSPGFGSTPRWIRQPSGSAAQLGSASRRRYFGASRAAIAAGPQGAALGSGNGAQDRSTTRRDPHAQTLECWPEVRRDPGRPALLLYSLSGAVPPTVRAYPGASHRGHRSGRGEWRCDPHGFSLQQGCGRGRSLQRAAGRPRLQRADVPDRRARVAPAVRS